MIPLFLQRKLDTVNMQVDLIGNASDQGDLDFFRYWNKSACIHIVILDIEPESKHKIHLCLIYILFFNYFSQKES